ncbi:UNVERIFIED_CONTAM: hypothetical protein FKN15_058735 [Acipenser sinensis]
MKNLRRKLNRLEQRKQRREPVSVAEPGTRPKRQRRGPMNHKRNLPMNSKRRLMESLVWHFLQRDDISTVINGKAGEIRRNGKIYRKRSLTDTMEHLHMKFVGENNRHKISRAQFCKLWPFWINRSKVSDRETCLCRTHENFGSKVKTLHQIGIISTPSVPDLVVMAVCDQKKMDCMYGQYPHCKGKAFLYSLDPSTKNNVVGWKEWVTRSTPMTRKTKDGSEEYDMKVTALEKKFATAEKLLDFTRVSLPNFCVHIYNISHQYDRMNKLKQSLADEEAIIHIDYSENYSCKYYKEVKEIHFGGSHQQVTLHTGVLYLSGGRVESFASLSSSLQHDAVATWAHLEPVLRDLRENHPAVTDLHFLSDGPTSQYRNKRNFYLASTIPFMKGFSYITWNFSEVSHGKGAPDGVGGALKNLADRIITYGTDVPNVETMFDQLSAQSSVKLYQVMEEDITNGSELIPPSLKSVPGTMKIHQVSLEFTNSTVKCTMNKSHL